MPPRDVVRSRRLTHAGLLKEQGWVAVWACAYGSLGHFDRQPVARSIWPARALGAPPRPGPIGGPLRPRHGAAGSPSPLPGQTSRHGLGHPAD